MSMIQIRLPDDEAATWRAIAAARGQSLPKFVALAVRNSLQADRRALVLALQEQIDQIPGATSNVTSPTKAADLQRSEVLCRSGHPNPEEAQVCSVCDRAL